MHETKLTTSRIRPDLTSVTEVLWLHSPKVPAKGLCPKPDIKLFRNNYLEALFLRLKNCSLSLKQCFRFKALQLVELQPLWKEWMRGHKYAPAVAIWLWALEGEFISTNWLPKASLLSKHNRWIHKFQIYAPSHLWAGDQLQSSCKRLNNNHCGSQLLSWVSLSSLLLQPSLLALVIKCAE